ncbi:hypothetical protein RchiOBHm_Chr3g0465471 [Rosa chinensis]|uniref:Uncharacterized protein n=1 Tax=Rosa chinensis TaxID=74649 RepID=A0A2P6R9Q6_ROSCH|nr:hypothetical protein RchiOBHm_Chr3g0465471 [Rosa chinensis]
MVSLGKLGGSRPAAPVRHQAISLVGKRRVRPGGDVLMAVSQPVLRRRGLDLDKLASLWWVCVF